MPNPYAILAAVGVSLTLIVGAFFYGEHVRGLACEVAAQASQMAAVQQAVKEQSRLDSAASDAAKAEAAAHPQIIIQTQTVTKWAIRHVQDTASCPTPDLIRVYNDSITGADPGTSGTSTSGTTNTSVPTKDGS